MSAFVISSALLAAKTPRLSSDELEAHCRLFFDFAFCRGYRQRSLFRLAESTPTFADVLSLRRD